MKNTIIANKLIDIKRQISELGITHLESQTPVPLSDVSRTLKPFININSSIDQAIKKFSSDVVPGSIPKSNKLKV